MSTEWDLLGIIYISLYLDEGKDLGRPLDETDFNNAANLNETESGGDEETLTYAEEHENGYDLDENESSRSATSDPKRKWPKIQDWVEIPYTISNTFNADERAVIASGMTEFQAKTCIK